MSIFKYECNKFVTFTDPLYLFALEEIRIFFQMLDIQTYNKNLTIILTISVR